MKSVKKRAIWIHAAVSLGVLGVLLTGRYFFLGTLRDNKAAIDLVSYFFFVACIFTGRWFCLKWFGQNKPIRFLLYIVPFFSGILLVWFFLIKISFNRPNLGFFEFSLEYGPFFLIGLIAGFLVKLIRAYARKQLNDARIKAEQKESELNLLQSQLSPHFLFNTLNNLYGISIADHSRVPPLLLKLSDLLRYSVYEGKRTFVWLKDELEYIDNYIAFEKIRISDRLALESNIGTTDPAIKIAPMVLIVFVENAFKHAKDTLEKKTHINIDLEISGNFIQFNISNSYRKEKEESGLLNEHSGLGLANTIKRLDLLYGDDYELRSYIHSERYHVNLRLRIM
jgi:sensor histidine kinase YesM